MEYSKPFSSAFISHSTPKPSMWVILSDFHASFLEKKVGVNSQHKEDLSMPHLKYIRHIQRPWINKIKYNYLTKTCNSFARIYSYSYWIEFIWVVKNKLLQEISKFDDLRTKILINYYQFSKSCEYIFPWRCETLYITVQVLHTNIHRVKLVEFLFLRKILVEDLENYLMLFMFSWVLAFWVVITISDISLGESRFIKWYS